MSVPRSRLLRTKSCHTSNTDEGAHFFITIDDAPAIEAMRLLAHRGGAKSIVAGESATAGLAALLGASADPDLRRRLALEASPNALLTGSEGATDPALYRELVGEPVDS